jgi:hypothetical protein
MIVPHLALGSLTASYTARAASVVYVSQYPAYVVSAHQFYRWLCACRDEEESAYVTTDTEARVQMMDADLQPYFP